MPHSGGRNLGIRAADAGFVSEEQCRTRVHGQRDQGAPQDLGQPEGDAEARSVPANGQAAGGGSKRRQISMGQHGQPHCEIGLVAANNRRKEAVPNRTTEPTSENSEAAFSATEISLADESREVDRLVQSASNGDGAGPGSTHLWGPSSPASQPPSQDGQTRAPDDNNPRPPGRHWNPINVAQRGGPATHGVQSSNNAQRRPDSAAQHPQPDFSQILLRAAEQIDPTVPSPAAPSPPRDAT
ncbi:hypothetical protein OQA88_9131 [Cercophora sp. LCS_1]